MTSKDLSTDSPDAAAAQLTRFLGYLATDPQNLSLRAEVFDAALAAGRLDLAQRQTDWVLARQPVDFAWRHRQAVLSMAEQRWDEASLLLHSLLDEGQDDPVIAYNLAYVEFATQRFREAAERLRPLLQAHLDRVPEALTLLLRCLHRQGAVEEGVALFEQHRARCVSTQSFGAASLLAVDAHRLATADTWSSHALALEPGQHEALVARASVLLARREGEAALTCLQPALEARPDDGRTLSAAGMAWLLLGDLGAAHATLSRAVAAMPGHIGTWHALGWSEIVRNDLPAAHRAFEQALALDRNFGESHGGLAVVQALQGQRAEAEASVRRSLRLDPAGLSARYAQAVLSGDVRDPVRFRQMALNALAGRRDAAGRPLSDIVLQERR